LNPQQLIQMQSQSYTEETTTVNNNYSHKRYLFERKIEEAELPMMKLAGMPDGAIQRHWATFSFDGQEFKARYFTFGDESKPTLLMTLGKGAFVL